MRVASPLQRECQGGGLAAAALRIGVGTVASLLIALGSVFGFVALMAVLEHRVSVAITAAILLAGGCWLATRTVKPFLQS